MAIKDICHLRARLIESECGQKWEKDSIMKIIKTKAGKYRWHSGQVDFRTMMVKSRRLSGIDHREQVSNMAMSSDSYTIINILWPVALRADLYSTGQKKQTNFTSDTATVMFSTFSKDYFAVWWWAMPTGHECFLVRNRYWLKHWE